MLYDTDVIIWFLRDRPSAVEALRSQNARAISMATWFELVEYARNKRELAAMKTSFRQLAIDVVPLTEAISDRAGAILEKYCLSHGLDTGDALVASTALCRDMRLMTGNRKHFQVIPNLKLDVFIP